MEERYSMREYIKIKYGETDKSLKGKVATKRASKSVEKKSTGKYITKIVDGVKYMVLR